MLKILRIFFIIPTILLIVGLGVLVYLYKDSSITKYLEENVEGLKVNTLETTINNGEVHFNIGGDYLDTENNQKLVELESMKGSLDFEALGFGAIIVPNVHVDHLVIQPELFTHFSEPSEASDNISSGNASQSEEDGGLIPDFDLDNFDRREWLERFTGQRELASEKYIKSMKDRANGLKQQWDGIDSKEKGEVEKLINQGKSMISDWDKDEDINKIKTKIDELKKTFESLKGQKFDKDNIAGLLQNVEKIKNLQKETESVKGMIKDAQTGFKSKLNYANQIQDKAKALAALPKQIQGDISGFQKDLKGLQTAIKQDQELLKKELNFKNFDTAKITRLLFGKEWSDELQTYLDLWYKIEPYLSSDEESEEEPTPEQLADELTRPVKYERYNNLPDWALKQLSYTGRSKTTDGEEISFQGNLHHLSSDEAAHGNNPAFDVFGRIAGTKGGTFNINGAFSGIDPKPEKRYLKLDLKGRKIENKVMGNGSSQVIIKNALLAAHVDLNLTKVPYMNGTISLQLRDASFDTGEKVKPMVKTALLQALDKTFTEPLLLHFEYQKGWASPKIKVDQRLDEVFKEATSGLVASFAKEQQGKLLGDFSQKMTGESSDMLKGIDLAGLLNGDTSSNLTKLSQNLLGNLNLWNKSKTTQEKQVNQQQDILQQLLASMTNETDVLGKQQNDLKSQAKGLIEKTLTDKLFGGSKDGKAKEGEEKKEGEKPSIKKLEDAFKGLF